MRVGEVLNILDKKISPSVKWKNDPSGLLVGDKNVQVKAILTTLNPTLEVAKEAKKKGCNLIVSHHPLFKKPVNELVEGEYYSDIIRYLIKNDISLISCHTNYDLMSDGVSYLLAEALGLKNIKPLIPVSALDELENYPSDDVSDSFGLGSIGELKKKISLKEFCSVVSVKLGTDTLRIAAKDMETRIGKVAVCGGSGAASWKFAFKAGADVFITSEFNHHFYQEASHYINIVDATHHSTEQFAKKGLKEYLMSVIGNSVKTTESEKDTDAVKSFKELN
jgi:dinuclear metal center YbgI/SA1388 family protein